MLNPTWISKHMPSEVWDEITYAFPNFNGAKAIKFGNQLIKLYNRCSYVSMLGSQLNHISTRHSWCIYYIPITWMQHLQINLVFLYHQLAAVMYLTWSHLCSQYSPTWWRHQMETFSALLAICAGNSPVTGEIPTQRPVTRRFDIFLTWINSWVNNREAGNLRRHRAHYDVTVMKLLTQSAPTVPVKKWLVAYHNTISLQFTVKWNLCHATRYNSVVIREYLEIDWCRYRYQLKYCQAK